MTNSLRKAKLPGIMFAGAMSLAACVSPTASIGGNYTKPIGGSPVTVNPTPYSAGLVCMGDYARAAGIAQPKIAVGRILDYTGKEDFEGGRRVTQGASLMAISAFAKAGARLVERFDSDPWDKLPSQSLKGSLSRGNEVERSLRRVLPG